MPLPYTGKNGELRFEADFVEELTCAGWEKEILKNKTIPELIENWKTIIFERNRIPLNNIPLSDEEMERVLDIVNLQANTPVKANQFINGRPIAIKRDNDSNDTTHAGKEVYLDLFSPAEIAGGKSRYQIAEQTIFVTDEKVNDRRGDVTLLINGMPVIHIEFKASGVDANEAADQIIKYSSENIWKGFMGLVQVFWAISPEDAFYFTNAGEYTNFNSAFFFRWGDINNKIIKDWKELITGEYSILSIPEAHKLIGYYTVADTGMDVLKVCRSYQYAAIRAIVKRTSEQRWGDHDQLGGFIWCTTGGGKTLTSFKAGQLIIDLNLADKVVFLVDRKALDEQSAREYNSFERPGEEITVTSSTRDLFNKLKNSNLKDKLILTSIHKISRITDESESLRADDLEITKNKRIVFIIDEAHRSQFGTMHERVKQTFFNALFFGFTGTPIFAENMKEGELTTETVFGKCLSIYSLATGIRDGNVLGFWPEAVRTYKDEDVKRAVALKACGTTDEALIPRGTESWKLFRRLMNNTPMATEIDENGVVKKNKDGTLSKGIEDYLPSTQYDNEEHRRKVFEYIKSHFSTISKGENGTIFSGILATSTIPEAYEYWKIFKENAPEIHVTAIFDTNTAANSKSTLDKERALVEIVDDYNEVFGTKFNRKTDPQYEGFKKDLISRLSHKETYKRIGNNHAQILDIVIVVDQLLTGFDSNRVNVLYLDKVMESDSLIQAISRTNRVYDQIEKPWGMVKFFRKPYTMERNLREALKLYCQGDFAEVEVCSIEKNLTKMNQTFEKIKKIFEHDKIENFEQLPKSDEDRQKFRKEFLTLKSLCRAVQIQGMKWTNEYGKELNFDEKVYRILGMRYSDLSISRVGVSPTVAPGLIIDTNLSTMEIDKIDADYLESQFKIATMKDITKANEAEEREKAIREMEVNLATLPELEQRYAKEIIDDLRKDRLKYEKAKTFRTYIQEYRERHIKEEIKKFSEETGLDIEKLYLLYMSYSGKDIDLQLEELEKTADTDKIVNKYKASVFMARTLLHEELKSYIQEQKADRIEVKE